MNASAESSDLVTLLIENQFSRKVYEDQIGAPVFFRRSFQLDEVPALKSFLATMYVVPTEELIPMTVIAEISEQGDVFQITHDLDCHVFDLPADEAEARRFISMLGIECAVN